MKQIKAKVIVYESVLEEEVFFDSKVVDDLSWFKQEVRIILTNRLISCSKDVLDRVYTRAYT